MSGKVLAPPTAGGTARRLSTASATSESLSMSPSVAPPPADLMATSKGHALAAAMDVARHHVDHDSPGTPGTPADSVVTDRYAFAFDIDGVLIRGGKVIPQAVEAMKVLNGQNELGIKVQVT